MRFVVDAQLPRSLCLWLQRQGHEAVHTLDLPEGNSTSDLNIIDFADKQNRVVITKDNDFVNFRIVKGKPEKILLITTGNIRNKALIRIFENNFEVLSSLFTSNAQVVEMDSESITVII